MSQQELSEKDLIDKARKPEQVAVKLHSFYHGKMQTMLKSQVRDFDDFANYYNPGVAGPCRIIQADADRVYELTNIWNTVAIVSDCTRVLGLGNIGPKAGYPVMEGKALLFKYLGGVDAVPICLNTTNATEIIQVVGWLQHSFGGINLEDIASPKCFYILSQLREELTVPVWHDDQQGTAIVMLAGLLNSLKIVGKSIKKVRICLNGAGAANIGTASLLIAYGIEPGHIVVVDSKGTLHPGREDLEEQRREFPDKWRLCQITNEGGIKGKLRDALKDADVLISCSRPGPGVIAAEDIKLMANEAICFTSANPVPEIWPWDTLGAGARIVGTGRSDFPNQLNNSMAFPGIFRGVFDVGAKAITNEMCIAAAEELAQYAEEHGLSEKHIVPTMLESEALIHEAVAVGMKAQELGIARIKISRDDLYKKSKSIIVASRGMHDALVSSGYIAPAPE